MSHDDIQSLPREIVLRQKQYAYYRDLLLRFPKPLATDPNAKHRVIEARQT